MSILRRFPGIHSRELQGAPLTVDGYTVIPVARLTGRSGRVGDEASGGSGAFYQLAPAEVRVRSEDGAEQIIPIRKPMQETMTMMASFALAAAAGCSVIMLIVTWLSRVKQEKKHAQ